MSTPIPLRQMLVAVVVLMLLPTWPAALATVLEDHRSRPDTLAMGLQDRHSQDDGGEQTSLVGEWLAVYNKELESLKRETAAALWRTMVHPSPQASTRLQEAQATMAEWLRLRVQEADRVRPWAAAAGERRMLHLITRGPRYTAHQARSLSALVSRMRRQYSTVVLSRGNTTYRGERDLTKLMRSSRDSELLLWAWQAWHDALGPPIRPLFVKTVAIMNQAARQGGYNDMGAAWRSELEFGQDVDVWAAVERVYDQVAPLYTLVHAHVRAALSKQYGQQVVDPTKPIPAHLLGDLWGQDWSSLLELILPTHDLNITTPREAANMNCTNESKAADLANMNTTRPTAANRATPRSANLTTRDMVQEAEGFYHGLGFPPLPNKFWLGSVLGEAEVPAAAGCHPRALDMFSPGDYRMMMCEAVGEEGLRVAYHELGHVHYFHAYSSQPAVFRAGANSAFHETIGDTVHLAAATPPVPTTGSSSTVGDSTRATPHLEDASHDTSDVSARRGELRRLLQVALSKLPLLAFARVLDEWRWSVFQGTVQEGEYNTAWWFLKQRYQGVVPPSPRSEQHFDPAAKFHVPDNTPYIRYLVAVVAQFQVHRGLCEEVHGRPLPTPPHTCTIAGSHTAGALLRRVMSSGSRLRWSELLEALTGMSQLDAGPLLQYLEPLDRWLRQEARARGLTLGW